MIDETPPQGLNPRQVAEDLALKKALAVAKTAIPHAKWIFGADTIVVLEGEIFGKPADRNTAARMLARLAAKRHEVITAMALHNRETGVNDCRSVSCTVEFASMAEVDIDWYLETGEWQGAAGAYRLQERGGCLIKSVNGSPSAVAGLPLHEFYAMLRDNGCHFGA
jgi:septum formation protein